MTVRSTRSAGRGLYIAVIVAVCFVVPHAAGLQSDPAKIETSASQDDKSESMRAELARTSREAAGEDETAEFKHSSSVQFVARITGLSLEHAYWLCVLANFAVIAGLLGWALKKSLPGLFRGRTASIQKAMAEARAASEDANRRLAEIEARLSRLDGEISEMRGVAEMETQAEEERIKSGTADDVRKVVESAEQEIAAAAKFARRELQAFAAELVVNMAEKQVQVDAATDQALVKGFAQQLAADGKKDGR